MAITHDNITQDEVGAALPDITLDHLATGTNKEGCALLLGAMGLSATATTRYGNTIATPEASKRESTLALAIIDSFLQPKSGETECALTPGTLDGGSFWVATFLGVDESEIIEVTATAGGNNSSPSTNITTLTDGAVLVDVFCAGNQTGTATANGSQTVLDNQIFPVGGLQYSGGVSMKTVATAGATSMSWTLTDTAASKHWAHVVVALKPSSINRMNITFNG